MTTDPNSDKTKIVIDAPYTVAPPPSPSPCEATDPDPKVTFELFVAEGA
eukprot:CAMPEP_0173121540 /NCGR_PEP_ID=MMETSP1102-20130122/53382_1 /TAXON_ID=49646 /ORGANISM="Geminigera sp., Strain Caron Lab Isolate" /LENGTH=48 /DNA_ID= /DNA_START= /DNA_END= /DNA_ORIENTATION=